MKVKKLKIKMELVLDDLVLVGGEIVDGIKIKPRLYKVFVRNGWWAVPAKYFNQSLDL